ncbi:MAG: uncharacterized protein KVP18_003499 [Porospora cf. gigantea A]|uniref:uncharacterized protein n=1 Tax=Porospora cf. gigantea A TaxID=2853593 RepID=UPI00355A22C3|nr:MAG: hypothetical protein KVP18_003499 [Porospora cf. gigantea A]
MLVRLVNLVAVTLALTASDLQGSWNVVAATNDGINFRFPHQATLKLTNHPNDRLGASTRVINLVWGTLDVIDDPTTPAMVEFDGGRFRSTRRAGSRDEMLQEAFIRGTLAELEEAWLVGTRLHFRSGPQELVMERL